MYAAHDTSLYNARLLLRDLHPPFEGIQLMSIAGYEAFICVCFFMYKHYVQPFIWLPWNARSCPYVCLYCVKKKLIPNFFLQKSIYQNKKEKYLKKRRDAAAKKNRYKRSRDK